MAQASPNFSSILDKPSSSVEKPKPWPVGTYTAVVTGLPRQDKSAKKQTPFVEFTLKPLSAEEDVDQEALDAMGGIGEKTIRATYYLTEDALWRLQKFLGDCGIETETDESLRQLIDQTPGCQVKINIKHRASDDGETIFAEIGSTAAV
jgi:hypothetical protein